MEKIISKNEFRVIRDSLKNSHKKVILCHGVFDLLHPGHIQHFQEAKSLGDVLVVSVTSAPYVRKGPDRPYFNDQLRLHSLAAIGCIDYVILSEGYTVDDIVKAVQPDIYVKGQEYHNAEADITGKISEEIALVRKYGGDIYYTNGEVFSSTKLINQAFPIFRDEIRSYLVEFKKKYDFSSIVSYIHKMEKLKILVIGDVIIDNYVFCKIQGLMSKNIGYSAKYICEENYLGGSLAIASHLSEFSKSVTLMSVVGNEDKLNKVIDAGCENKLFLDLVRSERFSTIIKKRYVERDEKRKELNKIFVINNLADDMEIDDKSMNIFKTKLKERISGYDVVFLCDLDNEVMDIVQEKAKKLILNCQTNSSNYGLNPITKYENADFFSLDEKELRLAFGDYKKGDMDLLMKLSERLNASGWLTKGSKGAVSIFEGKISECPAFILDVMDTIGAGDAFFSLAGLAVAVTAPMEIGTFLGNIAGALAANVIGNKSHVEKVNLMKYVSTLLNF